ncbi:MAG: Crp/Fnr family transcriptional regulator [Chitinophagales bacterium]|jgi:CRP/FNR family transcriptional regulator, anaerobic regulatory protein|nr:Crp/Fnr family transcriptional regulator [Chitinophagales bacterium]
MHEYLLKSIRAQIDLSDEDAERCIRYFEPVVFPKHHIIEHENKVPQHLYFVVSGYLRLFYYDDNGDEVTTHINCPPGFITSYFSFIQQTKASDNLECISACELLRISKKNLDLLTAESDAIKNFSIQVYQQSITYNENRAKELATLTAEQRYQRLVDNYPEIIHNVPLQYIASFLGMNPKSLSRIRRQMIK